MIGDPGLVAAARLPLSTLPAGVGTALFLEGSCFHPERALADLSVEVGSERSEVTAFAMPRPQPDGADVSERAFRSGFWAIVGVPALEEGAQVAVSLVATLEGGEEARARIGSIAGAAAAAGGGVRAEGDTGGPIAVCMATYEPDPELLGRQLDSLRAQEGCEWVCVISDDCSSDVGYAAIVDAVGDDPRFTVSRSGERLGFYRNFERAMTLAPPEASFIALCDQDDRWYPDKLATLRAAIGSAQLVYSDQRLVDRNGGVLRESLWVGRRQNETDIASMAIANSIVGASMLIRRSLLARALPFPEGPGWAFHDGWLSVLALTAGEVRYVDRPLYDYVQHRGGVVSQVGAEGPSARVPLRDRLPKLEGAAARWRGIYFRAYEQQSLQAAAALSRCEDVVTPTKARALRRLIGADRSALGLIWMAVRPLRSLAGHNETLASEWHLLKGLLWLRLLRARMIFGAHAGGAGLDATIPPLDIVGLGQRRLKKWLAGG